MAATQHAPHFSARGEIRLRNASPLMEMLCCVFANQYSKSHPCGPVSLGVAENSLMHADLLDYCREHFQLEKADFTYGSRLKGSERLFNAVQTLYDTYFQPAAPIEAACLVTGSGVGALMDQLIALLCDETDGVLIQAPYYSGFDKDLGARNGVKTIPVDCSAYSDQASPETLQAFENALTLGTSRKPSAVILCNPHNPLGFCYPRETLIEYCMFAERHNLHLIVDEIYALSVFETSGHGRPFTSILSIDLEKEAGCHPARVHHLYGASKDFCMNGLRVGVLHSKNKSLCDAFNSTALFIKVGSPSDSLFSSLVTQPSKLQSFVSTNQTRLAEAYNYTVEWLMAQQVSYQPSCAGHFIWIDLRPWLPALDPKTRRVIKTEKEQEAALFLHLLESGVYVAPGTFYHATQPGFFRLTFSVEREIMAVGLQRLKAALADPCCKQPGDQVNINGAAVETHTSSFTASGLAREIDLGVQCHC